MSLYNRKRTTIYSFRFFFIQIKNAKTMELLTGVPVANTVPLLPVISSIYLHFMNMSEDFCASVVWMPATLVIFVYRNNDDR